MLHGHEPCGHGKDDTCISNPVDVWFRRRALVPPTPRGTILYEALRRCGGEYRIAGGIAPQFESAK